MFLRTGENQRDLGITTQFLAKPIHFLPLILTLTFYFLHMKAGPGGVACRQSQRPEAAEWTAERPRGPPRASLPQPQTPEQGGPGPSSCCGLSQSSQWDKTGGTRRRDSCLNSKTKAVATPTNQFKIPRFSTGKS